MLMNKEQDNPDPFSYDNINSVQAWLIDLSSILLAESDETISFAPVVSANEELMKLKQGVASLLEIIQTLSQKLTMLYKSSQTFLNVSFPNFLGSCSKYGLSPADAQTDVCTRNTNANGVQMPALCAVTNTATKIDRMSLKRKPDSECLEHVHLHNDCKKEKTCYLPLESKPLLIPTERTSVNNSPTQTFRNSLPLYDKCMANPQYGVTESDEHSRLHMYDLMAAAVEVEEEEEEEANSGYNSSLAPIKKPTTVDVVGLPNIGKSSLLNSLKRSHAVNVGATPGLTRFMQVVQLDKNVKLVDCLGVVMLKSGESDVVTALRNCIKIEKLQDPIASVKKRVSFAEH
ncbi:guanine nucleotide-binding protein-like NSN1 [Tanacetum coccineum]|uniref:Guanine nucleotide-binding protein-like NSN1 n=1 Tax=Tanacetum coccineum TaxID=301880 RepID=A0ABQ5DC93_9ASTR